MVQPQRIGLGDGCPCGKDNLHALGRVPVQERLPLIGIALGGGGGQETEQQDTCPHERIHGFHLNAFLL